jgi:hypothetical protein
MKIVLKPGGIRPPKKKLQVDSYPQQQQHRADSKYLDKDSRKPSLTNDTITSTKVELECEQYWDERLEGSAGTAVECSADPPSTKPAWSRTQTESCSLSE